MSHFDLYEEEYGPIDETAIEWKERFAQNIRWEIEEIDCVEASKEMILKYVKKSSHKAYLRQWAKDAKKKERLLKVLEELI